MSIEPKFRRLFEPAKLGRLALKNRIVMAPMVTDFAGQSGEVTDNQIEWYVRRAQGGVGLVTVEPCFAATAIDPLRIGPRLLRIDDDSYIPGLAELAEAVHDAGAKVGVQISAGAGAQARGAPWVPGREQDIRPVAPSAIPSPAYLKPTKELTLDEIRRLVVLLGDAAKRAKLAGFDVIELHAHDGYLIAEFLSPYFNKRTDQYGGTLDNRLRILGEIINAMRGQVGLAFPLVVRYSIDEFVEGGRSVEESQAVARRLEEWGVDGIAISAGIHGAKQPAVAPHYFPEGYQIPLAEAIKKVVKLPVILPGALGDPVLAEKVLREGKADFIALGRPLIADPDLPIKAAQGRLDDIRRCVRCNECIKCLYDKVPVRCALNAVAGRERRYGTLQPAERVKTVMIIGAGPAGMEAARMAALRGHKVMLCDSADRLGGSQLELASVPPHKEVLKRIIDYYSVAFGKLDNLTLRLGKEVTARWILAQKPEVVIVATGAKPLVPIIPGINRSNVFTACDVLAGKARVGQSVVITGGGAVGCETANFLSRQQKSITIIEMLPEAGMDLERRLWWALKNELAENDVKIITGATVNAITDEGVVASDKSGHDMLLKADTVVLALGMQSVNVLERELLGKVKELYVIGDAKQPRHIRDAISEGYVSGCRI